VLAVRGQLSGLERKTCEPIVVEAGIHRKPIEFLIGAGWWDDEAVMGELRRHVDKGLGDAWAVLIVDATTFPKTGAASYGVGLQWRGRLGEQENCRSGIFLAYAVAQEPMVPILGGQEGGLRTQLHSGGRMTESRIPNLKHWVEASGARA
jgi:SRSO17 transposase